MLFADLAVQYFFNERLQGEVCNTLSSSLYDPCGQYKTNGIEVSAELDCIFHVIRLAPKDTEGSPN